MAETLFALTRADVEFIRTLRRWQESFRGPGVKNTSTSVSVLSPRSRRGPGQIAGDDVAYFHVVSVHNNYILCNQYQALVSGFNTESIKIDEDIKVAKYPEVAKMEYSGLTLTDPIYGDEWTFSYNTGPQRRNVTNQDGNDEDQIIVPRYIPRDVAAGYLGSMVIAVRLRRVLPDDTDTDIVTEWQEIGPRAWAGL